MSTSVYVAPDVRKVQQLYNDLFNERFYSLQIRRQLELQAERMRVGYFRDQLDDASRRGLLGCIEDCRRSLVPVIVPITLVTHYVRRFAVEYLKGQAT